MGNKIILFLSVFLIVSCDSGIGNIEVECKIYKKYENKDGWFKPSNKLSLKCKNGDLVILENSVLYNNFDVGDKFLLTLEDLGWHMTNIHMNVQYTKYPDKLFILKVVKKINAKLHVI